MASKNDPGGLFQVAAGGIRTNGQSFGLTLFAASPEESGQVSHIIEVLELLRPNCNYSPCCAEWKPATRPGEGEFA
jgi:hypothetical protein